MAAATIQDRLMEAAVSDPDIVREEIARLEAEDRFLPFVRLMWPVVEPSRPLVEGWCLDCLCEHVEAVHRGEIPRLLVNIPPGMMKSFLWNVFLSAWEWGPRNRPDLRYVTWSYTEKLTIRDNRRTRKIIQSPLYQRLWGDRFRLASDQNAKVRYDTDHTGFRIAASIHGQGTGERGDRLVIDDAHKVSEAESELIRTAVLEWFSHEIVTRVNDDSSSLILVGQRTHLEDVYGMVLREGFPCEWLCLPMEFDDRRRCFTSVPRVDRAPEDVALVHLEEDPLPRWITRDQAAAEIEAGDLPESISLDWKTLTCQDRRSEPDALLWPARYGRDYVETVLKPGLRMVGGTYAESAQLEQNPVPRTGGMFQRRDFQVIPAAPAGLQWVRGWDLAGTKNKRSPYTASVKLALDGADLIIGDARRVQENPRGVYQEIGDTVTQDGGDVVQDFPQDPGQAGKDQVRHIRKTIRDLAAEHPELGDVVVRSSPESGDKPSRAKTLAGDAEGGTIYVVAGPWNDAFISECCSFPSGRFSDMVDAASRARARVVRLGSAGGIGAPEVITG